METTSTFLQYVAAGGALYCALAYVYGFVWRPKGDRRVHIASMLFTGIALGALSTIIPETLTPENGFALVCAVLFLIASVGCQSYCAFRGRKSDRRGDDRRAREADAPTEIEAKAAPKAA